MSVAEREVLFAVAVIWAEVTDFTCLVVTLNFTDIVPAETITLDGTAAFELLVRNWTVVAVCAVLLRVTVPTDELPPVTELGLKVTLATVGLVCGAVDPVVFRKISVAPFPLTSRARSGLVSPFRSAAMSQPPP